MTNRGTCRSQVFGDVDPGTECRVCGRDVDDGRRKTCSTYCSNLQSAVMDLLNEDTVRERVLERDEYTCQRPGCNHDRHRRAADHIETLIIEHAGLKPEEPDALLESFSDLEPAEYERRRTALNSWRQARREAVDRYGDPEEIRRGVEVDHIVPVADGGHPFDPANIWTLCTDCHAEKTGAEAKARQSEDTPGREELVDRLFGEIPERGERR